MAQQLQQPSLAVIMENLYNEVNRCESPYALKGMELMVDLVKNDMSISFFPFDAEDFRSLQVSTYCQILKDWISEKFRRLKQEFDFVEKEKNKFKTGVTATGAFGALFGGMFGFSLAEILKLDKYPFVCLAFLLSGAIAGAEAVFAVHRLLTYYKEMTNVKNDLENQLVQDLRSLLLSDTPDYVRWLLALRLHCQMQNSPTS